MEIYICKKCGSMSWEESRTSYSTYSFWIDDETLELEEEEITNSDLDNVDLIVRCSECDEEEMELLDLDEELKEIVNMDNDERLEWLTKYLVIQGVK